MAYGFVNAPGITGPELEVVRQLAQTAKDTADEAQDRVTETNVPNGLVQLNEAGLIPEEFLPGIGFVEMESSLPVGDRKQNTLYGLILADFGGGDEA